MPDDRTEWQLGGISSSGELVNVCEAHGGAAVRAIERSSFCFAEKGSGMREFAKEFYLSKAWRTVRDYIFRRDSGLCVRCGGVGEIVHHKRPLTPENISDPFVTLAEDNLELLCRDCHAAEHATDSPTGAALMFDEDGNLIERIVVL